MEHFRKPVESFYTQQYKLLKIFALWDLKKDVSKRWQMAFKIYFCCFLIFFMILFDWTMIMQIITNLDNMDEVIKVFYVLATAIAVMGKFLAIKIQNQSYEKLFKIMFQQKFLPENPQEKEIFQKVVRLSKMVLNFYASLSLTALTLIFMTQYLSDNDDEMPVTVYNPIDMDAKWKYNLMYVYQCLSLSVLCLTNVAFDSLSTSFFIHVKGQLDILGHRLENIGANKSQDFILHQLKDCVRYYNRIMRLAHSIEDLVSIPISLQIACSIFVLIANFYAMSLLSDPEDLANFIKFAIYQTCMLTQIFILCYFSNEVSLKSSELSFNLYMADWYNWNKVNRKCVLLMMIRFDAPIRIKTINRCHSFNLPVFTSIVNSSYSYFALLKRING